PRSVGRLAAMKARPPRTLPALLACALHLAIRVGETVPCSMQLQEQSSLLAGTHSRMGEGGRAHWPESAYLQGPGSADVVPVDVLGDVPACSRAVDVVGEKEARGVQGEEVTVNGARATPEP